MMKYGYIFLLSARSCYTNLWEVILRGSFFFVILLIFSKVWFATIGMHHGFKIQHHQLLWYLYFTELMFMSLGLIHLNIDRDVKSGNITSYMLRPISFLFYHIANSAGEYTVRFISLACLGSCMTYGLSGVFPDLEMSQFFALHLICFIAGGIQLNFLSMVGLSSLYIGDCTAIYWLWQRLMIVCGGLFIPIHFYPDYISRILNDLPFAALLGKPASLILNWNSYVDVLVGLVVWACVCVLLQLVMSRYIVRRIQYYGG